MFCPVIRGGRLTFAHVIDLKLFEIKDLKVGAAELKKRKGKKGDVGNLKFLERGTFGSRRVYLVG